MSITSVRIRINCKSGYFKRIEIRPLKRVDCSFRCAGHRPISGRAQASKAGEDSQADQIAGITYRNRRHFDLKHNARWRELR